MESKTARDVNRKFYPYAVDTIGKLIHKANQPKEQVKIIFSHLSNKKFRM